MNPEAPKLFQDQGYHTRAYQLALSAIKHSYEWRKAETAARELSPNGSPISKEKMVLRKMHLKEAEIQEEMFYLYAGQVGEYLPDQ